MMTEALKDLLPIVVPGLALTAIGANLTWSFGRDLYFGRASRNWREAHGHVVDRDAYSVNVGRGGSLSEAAFTYTYRVNGVEYTSNRYDYAGRNAALGYGSGLPAHSIGERISVWYDPFEPRRAVLVQGVQFGNYLRLLVGAVFLFSGVLLLGTASDVERSDPAMQGRNSSRDARHQRCEEITGAHQCRARLAAATPVDRRYVHRDPDAHRPQGW